MDQNRDHLQTRDHVQVSAQKGSYYPALDGLRGLAIILVVLLHNFGYTSYFFFGWLGVDIFFVLSGFLITQIILRSVHEPGFLRKFYIRRALRIAPVYYLTLFLCLIILPLFRLGYIDISYFTKNQLWLWIYGQNWLYIFDRPHGTNLLLHLWSLAVEEQFYLFWPVTILLVRKPKILLLIAAILLALVICTRLIIWANQIEGIDYYLLCTFTRIDGICIGCILALIMQINPEWIRKYTLPFVLSFAAINLVFYYINKNRSFSLPYLAIIGYTSFAFVFGYLVYEITTKKSMIIDFLFNNRPMKFFGKISYGLYVFHWPVFVLLFPVFQKLLVNQFVLSARTADKLSSVIVTLIGILISTLSYRYFESYFLNLKKRYT